MYFTFSVEDVSDEGNRGEENELAKTGGNTADGEEETNVVSCHHDEQEQVIFRSPYFHTKHTAKHHYVVFVHCVIQQINKETLGVQSESKDNSNIANEEDNRDNMCSPEIASEPTTTMQDDLKCIINNSMSEGKRRKTPLAYLKFCKVLNLFFHKQSIC